MTDDVRAGMAAGAEIPAPGSASRRAQAIVPGPTGCWEPQRPPRSRWPAAGPVAQDAASATSAADLGGMDALIAAAKEEGELNVIALPPDWANYGKMIETFAQKYGIKVNSAQPDASSQDEINAANQLRGQDRAPDVFDLGGNVALRNTDLFAPYKVATWDDIPDELKDPDGLWVSDYGGYMSIGYDAGSVPRLTSVNDLPQAGVPRQGRAERQSHPGGRRLPRGDDGGARQRRLGRRHRAGRRVLPPAEGGRELPAGGPDPGDDRVRPDPGGDRLGVPERRADAPRSRARGTGS